MLHLHCSFSNIFLLAGLFLNVLLQVSIDCLQIFCSLTVLCRVVELGPNLVCRVSFIFHSILTRTLPIVREKVLLQIWRPYQVDPTRSLDYIYVFQFLFSLV